MIYIELIEKDPYHRTKSTFRCCTCDTETIPTDAIGSMARALAHREKNTEHDIFLKVVLTQLAALWIRHHFLDKPHVEITNIHLLSQFPPTTSSTNWISK